MQQIVLSGAGKIAEFHATYNCNCEHGVAGMTSPAEPGCRSVASLAAGLTMPPADAILRQA